MNSSRLHFTSNYQKGVEDAALNIAKNINRDKVVVTKSTVPVRTNKYIKKIIESNLTSTYRIDFVSNPEFLREGHAVHDTFHGDRIVIGCENELFD